MLSIYKHTSWFFSICSLVCRIIKLLVYVLPTFLPFSFSLLQYQWMHLGFGVVGYLPGTGCGDEVLRWSRASDRREEGQLQPCLPWGAEIQASNPTARLDISHYLTSSYTKQSNI
jgi:hypothetical protein